MKNQKLRRPVLEASLSGYSVMQKLNFALPIFDSIFSVKDANGVLTAPTGDDLNQIIIFTAQYASFRMSNRFDPKLSTYVNLPPAQTDAQPCVSTKDIIRPAFYTIPLLVISHAVITRKMLIGFLPALSTVEKLNLILAIYDNICLNEQDLTDLKRVMKGYVRYVMKNREGEGRTEKGEGRTEHGEGKTEKGGRSTEKGKRRTGRRL